MLMLSSICIWRKVVLLNALTIFFLTAGTMLLLINIWHHPSQIILTKLDESDDAKTLESIAQSIGSRSERAARVKIQKDRPRQ
jgi:hypothetical protein